MPANAAQLTDEQRAMFEGPNFGHLATLQRDGSPQVTPVWVDHRDGQILVNTARGRQKELNINRDERIAISITDSTNPYRMVSVRGKVVQITEEGADEHIDRLAKKYLGKDRYPWHAPTERRVIVEIEPEHVAAMGV